MAVTHRPALAADYPDFARLFLELATGDPTPSEAMWRSDIAPQTWLFEQDGATLGYLYFQRLAGVGYIRHVVVAPGVRGRGIGRVMLEALAAELRAAGCVRWCLNVKPDNTAAIRLYERVGMRAAYRSAAMRFPWTLVEGLRAPEKPWTTCAIEPAEDEAIERAFELPAGQLAAARTNASVVLRRLHDPERPERVDLGFAAFNRDFPGAFPFRVTEPGLAVPLLMGLRPHARAELPTMGIVAESDPGLVELMSAAGARVHLVFDHYEGSLA